MMNPVVHFELPYADHERIARFYLEAFDWRIRPHASVDGYLLATTTDGGTSGIDGGLFPPRSDQIIQKSALVVGVEDLDAAMRRVVDAGGSILDEPIDIPGTGRLVSFADTEGNLLSMLAPIGSRR